MLGLVQQDVCFKRPSPTEILPGVCPEKRRLHNQRRSQVSNTGLTYVNGQTYVVTKLRREWVAMRGQERIELDVSPSATLSEAIRFFESHMRSF